MLAGTIGVVLATFLGHRSFDRWKVYVLVFGMVSVAGGAWSELQSYRVAQQLDAKNDEILRITTAGAVVSKVTMKPVIPSDDIESKMQIYMAAPGRLFGLRLQNLKQEHYQMDLTSGSVERILWTRERKANR